MTPRALFAQMDEARRCLAGLVVLLIAHAAGNIWWLRHDNHPIAADEALHMQFAEQFYHALFAPGDAGWGPRFSEAAAIETIYPPLLHILGAMTWIVLPYNAEALAFVNTLALLALLAGVYALTAALFSPPRALLAAVLVGFTPFLFGASRIFIQDILAAAFVVWTLYAAHRTGGFRRTGWVAAFAALAGLGLLARWTTPLYYAAPALLILLGGALPALRDPAQRGPALRRIGLNAGLLVGLALVLAFPWYWARLETLQSGYQETFAGQQGAMDWFSIHDWTYYLVYIINQGTFLTLFVLACAGFVVTLRRRDERFAAAVLLLWAGVAYIALTATWSLKAPAPRYIIPFLPALGIAAAAALDAVPKGKWRAMTGFAVGAILILQYANLTVGSVRPVHRIEVPLFTGHPAVQQFDNQGLVFTRDRVWASAARYYSIYRGSNWIERVLDTMHEQDRFRYMTGTPRLQYGLVRLPKVGLERRQTYYEFHLEGDNSARHFREPEAFQPLAARVPNEREGYTPEDGELVTWFERPKPVSAYSVAFEDEESAALRFVPQFWLADSQRWQSFGAVSAQTMIDGLTLFQQTDRVLTYGVRLVPTRSTIEPKVEEVTWYATVFPYRSIALISEGDSLEELGDEIQGIEYLLVGDIRTAEMRALRNEFIVIDRFDTHLSGFWEPVEITVLARVTVQPG